MEFVVGCRSVDKVVYRGDLDTMFVSNKVYDSVFSDRWKQVSTSGDTTVWKWIIDNDEQIYGQFTSCYGKAGAGALRKVSDETLDEINKIFEVTGGKDMFDTIERHSDRKAREMGFDGANEEYFMEIYTRNSNEHY